MSRKDIREDAEKCILYIEEIQKIKLTQCDKSKFKSIHKIAYKYLELESILEEKESKKYFKEIVSNIIHLLYSSSTLNKKIVNMLNRNSIDNLIKMAKLEFAFDKDFRKKHIEDKFKEIKFHNSYNNMSAYTQTLDYLLNEYKNACGYIHSTKCSYLTLYDNIKDYYEDSYNLNNVIKFYKRVLFIVLVIYEKDLKTKNHEILCEIRSLLEKDKLKEYVNFFYNADF